MSRAPAAVLLIAMALAATGCTSQASSPPASPPGAACAAQGDNNGRAVSGRAVPFRQWNRPADQAARVRAAGLDLLPAENLTVHYHAHLDVLIDGDHVPVPPELGISVPATAAPAAGTYAPGQPGIAPLHTHDGSGVLHVESPTNPQFTLGQLFTERNISLGPDHVGSYYTGNGTSIEVFVNGQCTGDPAAIVLTPHEEVAVVVTTSNSTAPPPPASYAFPPGL